MAIRFSTSGSTKNIERFLEKMRHLNVKSQLESIGQEGLVALREHTPRDSGLTAASWGYEVTRSGDRWSVSWTNTNVNHGVNVAILIQYGHGTGTGGYVRGIDFINPALKPVFDKLADRIWKVVTSA